MSSRPTVLVDGWLTTGHQIYHYGQLLQVHPEVLEAMAERVKLLPYLTVDHDDRRRIRVTWHTVEVRKMDDGVSGVWAEFEVDRELWTAVQGDRHVRRGFSYTAVVDEVQPRIDPGKPLIGLSADGAAFDPEAIAEARAALESEFNVGGGTVLQFSAETVALVLVILPVLTGMLSIGLYNGLAILLQNKRHESTRFSFRVRPATPEQPAEIVASLETSDPETLRAALATFEQITTATTDHWQFDSETKQWAVINPSTDGEATTPET